MAPLPVFAAPLTVPAKPAKANNVTVSQAYLLARTIRANALGYAKPKWVEFCEASLRRGCQVSLYEARRTNSKYVTLRKGGRTFKVRFSDYKPILHREASGDCDFFVGVTNMRVTNTGDALRAAMAYFSEVQ